MTLKRHTLRLALAGLIAAPLSVWAAGLGKLTVNSSLGQPLAAEIEILADRAELDSIAASLASEQAFSDAKLGMSPMLSGLRFTVEKRPSGRAVLKVTSNLPVNEPFIDLLVELSWASGKLTREFTMLLDPPSYVAPRPAVARAVRGPSVQMPSPAPERRTAAADTLPPDRISVRNGDTLGKISRRVKPADATIEQTMVGLFRANPRAFDGDNMNRLKAGVTLNVPEASILAGVPASTARREIKAQTDDWRAYRQSLADSVASDMATPAPVASGQASSGKLAAVPTVAPPPVTAQKDVLTLGKNARVPGQNPDVEEQLRAQEADAIASEKALAESTERIALLEKQIQDMQSVFERQGGNAAAREGTGAGPLAAPTPVAAPTWYEPLVSNPLYWAGGIALIGLGGLLWWTMVGGGRRTKPAQPFEDSLMKNDAPGVSIATHRGGATVNTDDSSFLTDFGQAGLSAIDTQDVDPVAEADVYMAYGRDSQAEEILKEAVVKYPERHEIRMKLLEIYAARRNTVAFESVASALLAALGNPPGVMWDSACELGRVIDPGNPLYGGTPPTATVAEPAQAPTVPPTLSDNSLEFSSSVASDKGVTGEDRAFAPDSLPGANAEPTAITAADMLPEFDLSVDSVPDIPALDAGFVETNGPDSKFDFSGLDLDLGSDAGDAATDEVSTKLDLARAYVEMGDKEGAREILGEVMQEGSAAQKASAQGLLDSLS